MKVIKKSSKILFVFCLISLIAIGVLLSLILIKDSGITNIDITLNFNGDNTFVYVQDQIDLNQTHFRIPGTQGREDCAQYYITKFQEINSNFTYIVHNFTIHTIKCQNVLFKLNQNFSNIIIIGAHYDSRARATKDPIIENRVKPVPGANDGASGSAVLIELARVLYQKRENLTCQVWFLFFDAEDQGYDYAAGINGWNWCEGSNKFVNDINLFYNSSKEHFDCMILLDMVGGLNLKFINEQNSRSSLLNELFEIGRGLGYTNQFPVDAYSARITDDHVGFENIGIPSADLIIKFWDNPDWPYHHTIEDDLSHISNASLEITGKTIEQFVYNNYLNIPNKNYKGYYPWNEDINIVGTDIIIYLTLIISVLGISFIIIKVFKKRSLFI